MMIVAALDHIAEQVVLTPNLRKAIAFLKQLDLTSLQEGRRVVDGESVFAIVASYSTNPIPDQVEMEIHRKYIDLQFMAHGEEAFAWAPFEQMAAGSPYDPNSDAQVGYLPASSLAWIKLTCGQVAVLYPTDAHAPQHASGAPASVWKVVVKAAIEPA